MRLPLLVRHAVTVMAVGLLFSVAACTGDEPEAATPAQQAQALLNQAVKAHESGQTEVAEEKYLAVIKIQPQNRYALFDLGLMAQQAGSLPHAQEYYEQSLQSDPRFRPALFNLAVIKTKMKQFDEAVSLYRRLVAAHPDAATGYLNLGFALLEVGDDKGAGKAFSQAIELDPSLESRLGKSAADTLEGAQPQDGAQKGAGTSGSTGN